MGRIRGERQGILLRSACLVTPVSSPLTGHDLLHFARLRYFARRLAVVTDSRERDYLTGEIAFERRTLGDLGVDMSPPRKAL